MKHIFLAVGILCILSLLNLGTPYQESFWNSPCAVKSMGSNSYVNQQYHHHYYYGVPWWGFPNHHNHNDHDDHDDQETNMWILVIYAIILIPLMFPLYQTFYCHYPTISMATVPLTIYLIYRTYRTYRTDQTNDQSNDQSIWMKRVILVTLGISLFSEILILINLNWLIHLTLLTILGTSMYIVTS